MQPLSFWYQRLILLQVVLISLTLFSCTTMKPDTSQPVVQQQNNLFGFIKPYRIDIQQGNFVSKEMVAQLQPGMTREQVQSVLGTPLLTDLFHADRWDYLFRLAKGKGQLITSHVTVFFKDDGMDHYEGGENLPTEQAYLALIAGAKRRKNNK